MSNDPAVRARMLLRLLNHGRVGFGTPQVRGGRFGYQKFIHQVRGFVDPAAPGVV